MFLELASAEHVESVRFLKQKQATQRMKTAVAYKTARRQVNLRTEGEVQEVGPISWKEEKSPFHRSQGDGRGSDRRSTRFSVPLPLPNYRCA